VSTALSQLPWESVAVMVATEPAAANVVLIVKSPVEPFLLNTELGTVTALLSHVRVTGV